MLFSAGIDTTLTFDDRGLQDADAEVQSSSSDIHIIETGSEMLQSA